MTATPARPEPTLQERLAALRELAEQATPGPWGVRYFENDHEAEKDRFSKALDMSKEHDAYAGATCWRIIAGSPNACNGEIADDEKDPEWVNLGFMGNGPTSAENAMFIASADPQTVLALAARIDSLEAQLAASKAMRDVELRAAREAVTRLRGLVATAHRIVSAKATTIPSDDSARMYGTHYASRLRGMRECAAFVLAAFEAAGITGEPAAPERKDPTR